MKNVSDVIEYTSSDKKFLASCLLMRSGFSDYFFSSRKQKPELDYRLAQTEKRSSTVGQLDFAVKS